MSIIDEVNAEEVASASGKPVPKVKGIGAVTVIKMRRDPLGLALTMRARYGNAYSISAFGTKMVLLSGADAAEELLLNKKKVFENGPAWSYFIGPFFNRGLLLLDFDEHRHHRMILQQAFTPKRLQGYFENMQPMIEREIKKLPQGRTLFFSEIKQITLDLALEVFLGLKLSRSEADKINKAFIDTVRAGVSIVRRPMPGGRWNKGLQGREVLEEFFRKHLPEKRSVETPDLFSALCHVESEEGHTFTDDDVINHMIFVLMAAHDTSTISLSQMAYHMAKNPQWQEKARQQSLELTEQLSYEDLTKMTAIDGIFKESLRLCPPVPTYPRIAKADTVVNGYQISKGTMVVVPNMGNHRDPDYYTYPHLFDPERYSPERAEDKGHRSAWVPFGGGVHKCIGLYFGQMEIKTIMHHLLRNFTWSVPESYIMPMDYSSLPVPKDKLPVYLSRR